LGGIHADELVTMKSATYELPTQFGAQAPGSFRARQPSQLSALLGALAQRALWQVHPRVVAGRHDSQSRSCTASWDVS